MRTHFVNTDLFREAALHFEKHGYYCDAPAGTRDWEEYWDREWDRCVEGYSVGGVRITGLHYFYLNYSRMELVNEMEALKKGVDREWAFPHFWDGDYNFFWALHIAKNGIGEKEFDKLGLDVRPVDLDGGHHMVVLKARGKGYSYKSGAILAHSAYFYKGQKNFALANEWEYLTNDGLLNKTWGVVSHLDDHTAWAQPKLKDTLEHKRFGYKKIEGGIEVELGSKSEIMGVSCKDDPDKARGKRGRWLMFEEAGKFPGLLKAWQVARPSVEQGRYTFGTMIAYGTGGTEEANYESLEELFYNPEGYNVQPFENQWDEGGSGSICGYFVPSYQNYQGFIDESGNSDEEAAREYLETKREKIRSNAKVAGALEQAIAEDPFTPREATLQSSVNSFPVADLISQLNQVTVHRRWAALSVGRLLYDEKGKPVFRVDKEAKAIFKFPLHKNDDMTGAVWQLEAPFRVNGDVPQGLYTICHDPYAHDKQITGGSLGAAFVIKRSNNFSLTYPECVVASYVGRPKTLDEYNHQLFMLAEYYNCKIGYESDRGEAVLSYAKRFQKLHLLEEEPELVDKKNSYRRGARAYGISMTEGRKQQAELYLRDWLVEPIRTGSDGSVVLRLHTILDPALLQELIKFDPDPKKNFDRVSALFVGMYYLKDKEARRRVVEIEKESHHEFFSRDFFKGGGIAAGLPV